MKHPTTKRPPRSLLARLIRALWRWVDDLPRNDGPAIAPDADVPGLAARKARVWR